MKIHPEGYLFCLIFFIASALLWKIWIPLGCIGAFLTAWCLYFFRNPPRVTPTRPGLVISPADGLITQITRLIPASELELGDKEYTRISIFMNVFDVHINRIPIDGTVVNIYYHAGKFLNASLDKASEHNERQMITLQTSDGLRFGVVQIAGMIARRIRTDVCVGQSVRAGEIFGLIRFGSRVDVYLPDLISSLVVVGQRTIAGETILADITSTEPERQGEVR